MISSSERSSPLPLERIGTSFTTQRKTEWESYILNNEIIIYDETSEAVARLLLSLFITGRPGGTNYSEIMLPKQLTSPTNSDMDYEMTFL